MHFSISKTKAVTIFISVLLMTSVTLLAMPVKAQLEEEAPHGGAPEGTSGASVLLPAGVTPDYSVDSYAYLSARPKIIGLGQTLLVNVWITPGIHVAHYITGFKVTITKPDNKRK